MVMPLIWQTVHDKLVSFDTELSEMAKVFNISGRKYLLFVKLPAISDAINEANTRIRRKAMEDVNMVGMGTTAVLATISNDTLTVANVGDSRLYVISADKTITQITRDHSLVEEMVRMGGIDRVSARNHPDKNIITRAIGATGNVNIDFFEVPLRDGDIILMCSDGLSNMIEDSEILKIVTSEESLESKAAGLISTANENGGSDNISVVLIAYEQ